MPFSCPENEVFQLGAESVTIPLVESRGRGESSGFHNDARGHPRCGGCSRPRHAPTSRAEARPLRAGRSSPSLALHHTVQSLLLRLRQSSARGGGRRRTVCRHALDSPGTAGVCRVRTVTGLSSVRCGPSGRLDRAGGQEQVLAEACNTRCAVRAQFGLARVGREDLRLK